MNAATGTRRCRSTDPSSRILSERTLVTGSTRGHGLNAGPSLALRDRLRGWMVGLELRNACTSQVRAMYLRYRGKLPSARPRFASRDRSRLSWADWDKPIGARLNSEHCCRCGQTVRPRLSCQCHQITTPIPTIAARTSTNSKAEFSIHAIAGMPNANLPGKNVHAGGEGAERKQREDLETGRSGVQNPLHACQEHHVHHKQERDPVQ